MADSWSLFTSHDYTLTTPQYQNYMRNIFGTENYNRGITFQNSIRSNGYNILLSLPNAHFIIGTDVPTISAIKFQYIGNDIDSVILEDMQYDILGDGTVPYLSATMMKQVKNLDANRQLELAYTNHEQTISSDKALTGICNVLRYGSFIIPSDLNAHKRYIVLRIACPVEVSVNCNEETLSSSTDNLSVLSSFGCLDFLGENDDIKMLCIEESDAYTINLQGTAAGTMDYEIRWFDENNNITEKKTFNDVPITENTKILTGTDRTKGIVLNVDENGDGTFDQVINPDETVSTPQKWWQKLPSWLQWIMRYIFFGWVWMAF